MVGCDILHEPRTSSSQSYSVTRVTLPPEQCTQGCLSSNGMHGFNEISSTRRKSTRYYSNLEHRAPNVSTAHTCSRECLSSRYCVGFAFVDSSKTCYYLADLASLDAVKSFARKTHVILGASTPQYERCGGTWREHDQKEQIWLAKGYVSQPWSELEYKVYVD